MNLKDYPRPIRIGHWPKRGGYIVNSSHDRIKYDNLAELLLYNLEGIICLFRLTSCELIKEVEDECGITTISGIVEKM